MKLSIIVPVYNVQEYIEEALESIYNQKLEDFEVLCIDDKGNDDSIEIIKKFVTNNSINNLKILYHSKNMGLSEARNTGIKNAHGKYICFFDSDDKLEYNGLKELVAQAEKEDLDIIEGKVVEIFETECEIAMENNPKNRKVTQILNGDDFLSETMKNNEYLPISVCRIYKRELLNDNCFFMPGIKFEDEEFSPRAILKANRIQYANIPFYVYRRRDNSITTNMFNNDQWYESYIKIIDSLSEFIKQIRNKKSYEVIKNRIEQIALSILKNPIAYGATKEQTENIISYVKRDKVYKIPMKSNNLFIKIQGYLMRYPHIFVKLYKMRGKK